MARCAYCRARIGDGFLCAPCRASERRDNRRAEEEALYPLVVLQSDGSAATNVGSLQLWTESEGTQSAGWRLYGNDGFYIRISSREQALRALSRLAQRLVSWDFLTALKEPYTAGTIAAAAGGQVDRGNGVGED